MYAETRFYGGCGRANHGELLWLMPLYSQRKSDNDHGEILICCATPAANLMQLKAGPDYKSPGSGDLEFKLKTNIINQAYNRYLYTQEVLNAKLNIANSFYYM